VAHRKVRHSFSTAFHKKIPKSCDEQPLPRKPESACSPYARRLYQELLHHRDA
jgi:hypothetical protein